MKRIIGLFVVFFLVLTPLAACGKSGVVKYNVAVSDLADKVMTAIESGDNLSSADANYVEGMMGMDDSDYVEYSVNINAVGVILDEFGIFKGKDSDQTASIETAVKEYLQLRKDGLMPEYLPEENPKIERAEYRVVGNYVIYAMLSDLERSEVFSIFESELKG